MSRIIKYASFKDSTANDSDKSFTSLSIGAGNFDIQLLYLFVELTSTATAGNRLMTLEVQDADSSTIYEDHAGSYQAASNVYHYSFAPGIYRETVSTVAEAGVDGTIEVPFPAGLIIPKGYTLRVSDIEAVDAAADDMIVSGMVAVLSK